MKPLLKAIDLMTVDQKGGGKTSLYGYQNSNQI